MSIDPDRSSTAHAMAEMLRNMLDSRSLFLGLLVLTQACGAPEASADATARPISGGADLPIGATLGAEGYATILDAPPAAYAPSPPGEAQPPSESQRAAQEQFRRAGEFQNRVMDEVQALADRLRRSEPRNFVDLYYENEGEPHVVFRFLRDPEQTLAKYTRNPSFRAARARYTDAELMAAMDFMLETFREDRVILGGGTGNKENRATVEIAIPEDEFRALVARKGVTIPEAVELEFRALEPASKLNRPLPSRIAGLVRIFPRADRPVTLLPSVQSSAKVVLADGCFKIRGGEDDGALVLFPLGSMLFIDREGYLAYGHAESPGYARVGESLVFPGIASEVNAPELMEPIHAACGAGKVMQIYGMQSAAADRAQHVVETNVRALRDLRQMYGLPEPVAQRLLERCKAHVGGETCLLSPPPPVARQEDCPEGTRLSFGLCRTPEGHVRPLPQWLQALIDS